MSVTAAEVARLAGVSRSTVSYVLNGHSERFSDDVVHAVREAAKRLGYRPNHAARSLVRGQTDVALLIVPPVPGGIPWSAYGLVSDEFSRRGMSLVLFAGNSSPASLSAVLATAGPAVVMAGGWLPSALRRPIEDAGVPVVHVGQVWSEPGGLDWRIGRTQVEHLLHQGYERVTVGHLAEAEGDLMMETRTHAIAQACADLGLPDPDVVTLSLDIGPNIPLMTALPARTGLACFNDETAIAALWAARLAGRAIPQEIGLIGVDNVPSSALTVPALSTIDPQLPIDVMVDIAMAVRSGAAVPGSLAPDHVNLVHREST